MAYRKILLQGGHIFDGQKFFEGDVAFDLETQKIEGIGEVHDFLPDVVFDVRSKMICPGLVDAHLHIRGISTDKYGTPAEAACFPVGVTYACDCGGEQGGDEVLEKLYINSTVFIAAEVKGNHTDLPLLEERLQMFRRNAVGVKIYFDTHSSELSDITPLREVCDFARSHQLKVMVHCNHSPVAMAEYLPVLSAGDIVTHIYHGGAYSALEDGFAALKKARERGIMMDSGNAGFVHSDVNVLKRAAEISFYPDTISSDLTCLSAFIRGGNYSLHTCMSYFRTLGMKEEDILRAVTVNAGKALGKPSWGILRAGDTANLCVLHTGTIPYELQDSTGNILRDTVGYICDLTVANGFIAYRNPAF